MKKAIPALALLSTLKPVGAQANDAWSFRPRHHDPVIESLEDLDDLDIPLNRSVELVPFGDVDAHRRDGAGFLVLAQPVLDTGFESDPLSDPNFDPMPLSDPKGDDALYVDGYDRFAFEAGGFEIDAVDVD